MTSTHIVDYHVVTNVTIDALIADVKVAIGRGWQPIGGMTSSSHPTGGYLELSPVGYGVKGILLFSQALVKYAPKLDTERMSTGTYDSSKAVP